MTVWLSVHWQCVCQLITVFLGESFFQVEWLVMAL